MLTRMLIISVALLLTACTDTEIKEWQADAAEKPVVARSAATDFNPADTPQEQRAKAEARGEAQAAAALSGGDANERKRAGMKP